MSLEDRIAELTKAVTAQTDFLKSMAKGGSASASSGTAPKATGTAPKATGTKPKAITTETLGEKATAYMTAADDRAVAKANIAKISAKFDAERFTLIPEANRQEALDLLAQFEAGEDPFADEGGDDDSPI